MSTESALADPDQRDLPPQRGDRKAAPGWLPTALVVLATVVAMLSAASTWVRTEALDTGRWVDASGELLADPTVREAVATYLVDQLYADGEVAKALESALPTELDGLAGPIAGALRAPITEAVVRILGTQQFQTVWKSANRVAHQAFVAIVRNDVGDNVSAAGGAVVLDLAGVVRTTGEELGLPASVLDRLPGDVGQITVFESGELANVQDTIRVLDVLSWFLFILVVVLYALAVYLARGRRRETLRGVGIALVVGGVLLVVLRAIAVRATVQAIIEIPANRPAGRVVGGVMTQLLSDMAFTAVVIGLLIAGFAALVGPHRWSVAVRRRLGATSNPAAIIIGAGVLLLAALVWWSPGLLFERWVTAITLIAMISAAVVLLIASVRSEARHDEGSPPSTGPEPPWPGPGRIQPMTTSSSSGSR